MKKLSIVLISCITAFSFAQEKNTFKGLDLLLSSIQTNQSTSWAIVKSAKGKIQTIQKVNNLENLETLHYGFKLDPSDDTFYYIAYKKGKNTEYITDLNNLSQFIGKINTPEEAALKAITKGYYVDMEFKNLAASYTEDTKNYYLNIGKITSQKCPFQKKSFHLTIKKATGEIEDSKEIEKYQESYLKDCKNNPHRFIPPKKKKKKEVISIYG